MVSAFFIQTDEFGMENFERADQAADAAVYYIRFLANRVVFGANARGPAKLNREEQLKREIAKRLAA
jgi:hypothetical protein